MSQHGKPNPVVDAIANAVGAIRADDDMHALAKAHDALEPLAIEKLTPAEARAQPTIADAVKHLLQSRGQPTDPAALVPGVTRRSITIPTPAAPLRALVYTPEGPGPHPLVVYFHGGGWVIADAEVYDGGARGVARHAAAVVVSVDYRQAPEHKFPAAWDDALAAYRWISEHAAEFDADSARIALAGESAGGNLAVATAVAVRNHGLIAPRAVVAVYPVAQTGSLHTLSYVENAIAKPLNKAMIEWFIGHLLAHDDDRKDTRLDLVHANLQALPPVTIVNATIDPLRSDGEMLEQALREAGVAVERKLYSGVAHEFFGCAAVVAKAREAQIYVGERLRAAWA